MIGRRDEQLFLLYSTLFVVVFLSQEVVMSPDDRLSEFRDVRGCLCAHQYTSLWLRRYLICSRYRRPELRSGQFCLTFSCSFTVRMVSESVCVFVCVSLHKTQTGFKSVWEYSLTKQSLNTAGILLIVYVLELQKHGVRTKMQQWIKINGEGKYYFLFPVKSKGNKKHTS